MSVTANPLSILVLLFVLSCCAMDMWSRRIPNFLTVPAAIAGIAFNWYLRGAYGLLMSGAGVVVAVVVLLGPFAMGGIGGGDVKMMGAVGSLLGPQLVLPALVIGITIGGVVMVVHLLRIGRLGEKLSSIYRMLVAATLTKSVEPLRVSPGAAETVALPYSIPLALGTIAVIAAHRYMESLS